MNYNDVYGGPFFRPDDLPDRPVGLTIRDVELTEFEDRRTGDMKKQLVLHFEKTDKRLGLNKTNADAIAHMYGPETDGWIGQRIGVQVEDVRAFGEIKPAIRVLLRKPQPAAPAAPPPRPAAAFDDPFADAAPPPPRAQAASRTPAPEGDGFDDDIPF